MYFLLLDLVFFMISENLGEKDFMEKGVVYVGDIKFFSFKNFIVWKGDREKMGYVGEVIM